MKEHLIQLNKTEVQYLKRLSNNCVRAYWYELIVGLFPSLDPPCIKDLCEECEAMVLNKTSIILFEELMKKNGYKYGIL